MTTTLDRLTIPTRLVNDQPGRPPGVVAECPYCETRRAAFVGRDSATVAVWAIRSHLLAEHEGVRA